MNIISSISNPFVGKFIVCKSPVEDFNDNSILTVNPGEQAVFVSCGQIASVFDPGRYELNTFNYPFINAWRRFMANGQSTYKCSIYFISLSMSPEILWGLSLPVRDPVQGIYTKLFARGSYNLRVSSGEKIMTALLGMNVNFMGPEDIRVFFGNRIQQIITNALGTYITSSQREVLELCADNMTVTKQIQPQIEQLIVDTGFELYNFSISAMEIAENDPNRALLEQAYAKRRELDIMGDRYATIKDTDVRINASQTSFAGMSFNLPPLPPAFQNAETQQSSAAAPQNQISPAHDSPSSASPAPSHVSVDDVATKLSRLNELKNNGLITQQDYDVTKEQILKSLYE